MTLLPTNPFQDRTFDTILAEMLDFFSDQSPGIDTREGSFIWDALAPVAKHLEEDYLKAATVIKTVFIDTTFGAYMDLMVAEHGLERIPALKAIGNVIFTGAQSTFIPAGTQVSTLALQGGQAVQIYQTTQNKTIQPRSGNGTFQETEPSITYTGTWNSDATSKFSNVTNDKAEIYINGTSITIRFDTGSAKGIAEIFVDDVSNSTQDTYNASPGTVDKVVSGLAAGNHKIRVEVDGTKNASSSGFTINLNQFTVSGAQAQILDTITAPIEHLDGGDEGNVPPNSIVRLVSNLAGISSLTNSAATAGGADQESDADLRARFKAYVAEPPGSGNKADYIKWAKEASILVGSASVLPLWNGNGTVKVFIVDVNNQPADGALITVVQNYIDPTPAGTGSGKAPIGATVTVVAPTAVPIDVNVTITYETGFDTAVVNTEIKENIKAYLDGLGIADTIRFSQIANAIHDTSGVKDYTSLQFRRDAAGFGTSNIVLAAGEKATMDQVTIS